jgi:hypothetical protein
MTEILVAANEQELRCSQPNNPKSQERTNTDTFLLLHEAAYHDV